nr:MAG TPA: hypothetical protein [Caudoviricetes sp.]
MFPRYLTQYRVLEGTLNPYVLHRQESDGITLVLNN